jgi:photosystem II stability/assembly factor-like uncharacterized protein
MKCSLILLIIFLLLACEESVSETKKAPIIKSTTPYNYEWVRFGTIPDQIIQFSKNDDIYFVNANVGWAMASGYGEVYKTSNGGASWEKQLEADAYFRSMAFFDENVGFVGNLNGRERGSTMYMTEDGGATWNHVAALDTPAMDGVCGMSIADENTVYAAGRYTGRAIVAKSTDRGKTWSVKSLEPDMNMVVDVYFWHADSGIVTGGVGRDGDDLIPASTVIMSTFDGGATWTKRYETTRKTEWGWKLSFLAGHKKGFASIQSFRGGYSGTTYSTEYFLKTVDGGLTWTEHPFSAPDGKLYSAQAIGFVNDTVGWMGAWKSTQPALKTIDGGLTWRSDFSEGSFNRIRFLNDSTGFAIGNYLYRLKRTKK